jgi:hypothetical protein
VCVANRIQQIWNHLEPFQWNNYSSGEKPVDIASCGATADMLKNAKWFDGPIFLRKPKKPSQQPTTKKPTFLDDDPEVKRSQECDTKVERIQSTNMLYQREHYSDWTKVKRIVARSLKFKLKLKRFEPPSN